MVIRIKRLTDTARIPSRGSEKAAGYDLSADISEKIAIAPHTTAMIGTVLVAEIPDGYFGAVFARSGLAKKGLRKTRLRLPKPPYFRSAFFRLWKYKR